MNGDTEEFATEPVPEANTVGWLRVALIGSMVAFSLPTFITGLEVANAIAAPQAAMALLCGSALLTFIGCITASIGARTRLSSYMLVRIAFGDRGAAWVNLAFAISLLGWFGVNIDLFGEAVARLLDDVFAVQAPTWLVELGAGIVMTVTTVYGFRAINLLSLVLVPVLAVVTMMLVNTALDVRPLAQIMASAPAAPMALGDAISAVVGGVIVGAVILPDITRFVRPWQGALWTAVFSYLLIGTLVMGAGGLASLALDSGDLLDIMIVTGLGLAAFIIVIAGSWVLNSLNLYSTVLSVEATWKPADHRALVIALGALGTAAAFVNILDYFLTFLFYLAIIFVPVAGVIAVDYLLVRQPAYHEQRRALARAYSSAALGAWAGGALVALLGAEGYVRMSGIAALDAMAVSAVLYWAFSKWERSG